MDAPSTTLEGGQLTMNSLPSIPLETTYAGTMHSPAVILTVLESSKDVVEQVNTPHTHHLHTTTTHHIKKVCLEKALETRAFGELLDRRSVMRARAI